MTVTARPYVWNRYKSDAQEGVMINTSNRHAFIPAQHLRRIADRLHDIADDIESSK